MDTERNSMCWLLKSATVDISNARSNGGDQRTVIVMMEKSTRVRSVRRSVWFDAMRSTSEGPPSITDGYVGDRRA